MIDITTLPSVEEQREALRNRKIQATEFYRILHIGRYAFGKTDIVSRMKQALENLGHSVFDFNTDDFKEVIHNPDRHTGGFGPIEIKLDLIKPILKQFDPQIILCNAGGYTFSKEDSQWLKDQGYILIGITLSDPDVFVSTKQFADRFDYHATNAIEALKMYKNAGIFNTIHFPFAIDRSFIETEAIERRDWEADVICIGNATNREDRNRVMNYLNEHLNVKVYGTGWEIPGSFSVGGEDFFSAARAGKFHINFPGTRAGYTNLKIGVFESIANGAILCTEYFDEMEHFFKYGEEIIGYKDEFDLKEKIEYYLDHPEEAEEIRRKSFAKLVEKHMWESRWQELLETIKNDINEKQGLLDDSRYVQIGKLNGTKEKAAKVIIQGYYGALNTGDDLILESIIEHIRSKHPNTLFMVAGFNRRNITLRQGHYSLPRTDVFRMDRYIREADLLIYGGGGLLNDYTFNRSAGVPDFFDGFTHGITGMGILPTTANIHGVPRMYFALGVGPLKNPESRKFAKFMVNQMDVVTVRDEYSKQLLESIDGIENEIVQTSDPTYMLSYPGEDLAIQYLEKNHIKTNLILVSLRDWKDSPEDFNPKMASFLDNILTQEAYSIVFLPYQFGSGKSDDNRIHSEVRELMKYKNQTILYNHEGNYQEFLSLIGYAKAVISMRLHGSILANRFEVPSIGFNYDDKVKAHFQNVHTEKYLLDLNFQVSQAVDIFNDLQENSREISLQLREAVLQETIKSSQTFDYAVNLLEKGLQREKEIYRFYPREESLKNIKNKEMLRELNDLKKENRKLSVEKDRLENFNKVLQSSNPISFKQVDLLKANVSCETPTINREVITIQSQDRLGIRLSKIDAPKKKDFTHVEVDIDVEKKMENFISFWVHSPYYKPKNKGRIRYTITLEGKKVHREDIAINGEEQFFSLKVQPKESKVKLSIKIEALKNCENWSWGAASKVELYGLSVSNKKDTSTKERVMSKTIKNV